MKIILNVSLSLLAQLKVSTHSRENRVLFTFRVCLIHTEYKTRRIAHEKLLKYA
jgi:hypothetical protein